MLLSLRLKRMKLLLTLCAVSAFAADNTEDFLKTNDHVSLNLYKDLAEINNGSFIACPGSLQIIFSLITFGARGKTLEELKTALLLPDNTVDVTDAIAIGIAKARKQSKHHVFKIVNKVYVKDSFEIAPDFQQIAEETFNSKIENIDFRDRQEAANKINQWVSENTNNHIRQLVTKNDISEKTPTVLVNTIYLEATWNDKFTSIKSEPFYKNLDEQITVEMMEQNKQLLYAEDTELNAKFLKLRYLKSEISMIIALPYEVEGLKRLEANVDKVLHPPNFQTKKVHVKLPKFESTNSIDLVPILQKWGIKDLFTPRANLTGIGASEEPIFISQVLQKNYIQVNEDGTFAASASAVTPKLGARRGPIDPKEFIADHPFIYFISSKNAILFVGRYMGH